MAATLGKGELAEEALRNFFLEEGYFVVRSVPFSYSKTDITDVDLWIYGKTSSFTRERINIDIKNKTNPQAFERIIWAKGLQTSLKLERCLVATTSTKKEVREFALANDVIIIDGNLLRNLLEKENDSNRLVEESFIKELLNQSSGRDQDNWKERYKASKALLLNKFNFDGCNEYLIEIKYYLQQSILDSNKTRVSLRLFYLNISFFLICLDFIAKTFINLDQKSRMELLINGFNYGERGREGTERITNSAIKLASSVIANPGIARTLQMEVEKQVKGRPADILADFFCRRSHLSQLFKIAKSFEMAAFSSVVKTPSELPAELQGIVGLLADFFRLDRKSALF